MGAGNDLIDGHGGFDNAVYSNLTYTTGGVTVDMASGTVTGDASTGTDTLRSIEGVQGTVFADTYVATNFGATGFLDPSVNNVGNNGTFNQFEGLGGDDAARLGAQLDTLWVHKPGHVLRDDEQVSLAGGTK